VDEKRTVELRILDMSKADALALINEAYAIRSNLSAANIYTGQAVIDFNDADQAYQTETYSELQTDVGQLEEMWTSAVEVQGELAVLKSDINRAKGLGINTPQTTQLYDLANAAYARGDYESALSHLKDADLTYALETAQGLTLDSFLRQYWLDMIAALIALSATTLMVFTVLRFWMINNELGQLTNEEKIVLGLIKEIQINYFDQGRMSSDEYTVALEQYEGRLSKIVQRKVELETLKKNYLRFKTKEETLRVEKERLEQLVKELQKSYLGEGNVETRIYENRMRSYVTRLSEIEEKIAVAEAEKEIRRERGWRGSVGLGRKADDAEKGKPQKKKEDHQSDRADAQSDKKKKPEHERKGRG
jgi:hypothetical protein